MKSGEKNPTKELYHELRALSCERLWDEEVPRFNAAAAPERMKRVALVRAVGVVFSESGSAAQKDEVRGWLRGLLQDPCEKIRRYAMTALPKIGAGEGEEAELLALLRATPVEREKKFLGQALQKIGGAATLEEMEAGPAGQGALFLQTEQKVRAKVARTESPTTLRMDGRLRDFAGLRMHLRGRRGLEKIVRAEVEENERTRGRFKIAEVRAGLVAIQPVAPFSLADVYSLRCFGTLGFVLGTVPHTDSARALEGIAAAIASPVSRRIFETFTEGAMRYRLDFVAKGHQRGAVRWVANRAYALCPAILNDAQSAPWTIAVYPGGAGESVELSPHLTPDPRYFYREQDVPAASHPPLAACMARLGGRVENEIVWDPFCGSGLELIERALLGGVRRVFGTDRSAEAIAIAERNFAAAKVTVGDAKFSCCDFRDFRKIEGLGAGSVSLIVTNPPMGKRVPIGNLRRLIEDLFSTAATALKPGGRLILANPLSIEPSSRLLKLQFRQTVDFSGFDCRMEAYGRNYEL